MPAADRPPLPPPFSLFRQLSLADFITLGNAACGTAVIFLCLNYLDLGHNDAWIVAAFWLLPLAFVLDSADGYVARARHKQSPFGGDLDSLSDVISFGVAPAVLGFTLGLRGVWDAVILVYFVCCGVSRLARFNVTAAALSDERGKVRYFEGTPIPVSLLIVGVLAVAWSKGAIDADLWGGGHKLGPFTLHPMALLYAVAGSTMVSARLRIPKP